MEVKEDTTIIGSFIYDADGNRVVGTVDGTTTVYIGGLFEYQAGAMTSYYVGPGGAVALRRTGFSSDNGIFYLLNDHLGSMAVIVNENGTISAQQYYYPYGGNRGPAFSPITTKRFTGQYHEEGLPGGEGLSYYNARWYDPQLGRFVSADSIVPEPADPQSLNRYNYARGNPLRYSDPTGHRECGTDCSQLLPYTSPLVETLFRSWLYYESQFHKPFASNKGINQGYGPNHNGIDYAGSFSVLAPARGSVIADRFHNAPAGMWRIRNVQTDEIREWSIYPNNPGWQDKLYESDRGPDGLLEPERLLATEAWVEDTPDWSHSPGTMIRVQHDHYLQTLYIHTVPALQIGTIVNQGDVIGITANNGFSTGVHLHYTLLFVYNGQEITLNPDPAMPPAIIADWLQ